MPLTKGMMIISRQHLAHTHKIVHSLYKEVAESLGLYFPKEYGYAYPKKQGRYLANGSNHWQEFTVEAQNGYVTEGNLNFSLYIAMARLGDFSDRTIVNLEDRLKNREMLIKKFAYQYFTEIADSENVEVISDRFIVV
jgi:hypothetical protein